MWVKCVLLWCVCLVGCDWAWYVDGRSNFVCSVFGTHLRIFDEPNGQLSYI